MSMEGNGQLPHVVGGHGFAWHAACSIKCLMRSLLSSSVCRVEDLRYAAEKYGRVRDVYIPRDYYTG